MVSSIIGAYLTGKGVISEEQFQEVLYLQQKVRVKLGLIAVAEGLMSGAEADRVNRQQALQDKRFGDLAVEMGYLTEGQVESLLKKQGNAYMAFAQALDDLGLISIEQLEQCMVDFKEEKNLTNSDLEVIKSDDIDRILPLYLPAGCENYVEAAGVCVRTLARFVDSSVYPERAYLAEQIDSDGAAIQYAEGNPSVTMGLSGIGSALLPLASIFGQADFAELDEEAIDAVAEFVNCVLGLYASSISLRGVELELCPPEYSTENSGVATEQMLVLPLHVKGRLINLIIAFEHKMVLN